MNFTQWLFILMAIFLISPNMSWVEVADAKARFKRKRSTKRKKSKVSASAIAKAKKQPSVLEKPSIRKIQKRMARRLTEYQKYRMKKYIGECDDGLVKIRTLKKLSKKKKESIRKLVKVENQDREKLYAILVKDSKFDEKMEKVLRESFFNSYQEWAPNGTYFYKDGRWHKK